MVNFWKLAYETVKKQRNQYKEEKEELREQFDYRNQSYMKLYEENKQLQEQLEDNDLKLLEDVRHYSIKCKDLEKENKKLKEENEKLEQENRFLLSRKDNLFDSWRDENKRSATFSKRLEQLERENEKLKRENEKLK